MARRRPELRDWDGSWLRQVTSTDPGTWVRAVLATPLVHALQDPQAISEGLVSKRWGSLGRQARRTPFIRGMRWGEIREAIRRELERRSQALPSAYRSDARISQDASLRTGRGISRLRTQRAIIETGGRYRLSPDWLMIDLFKLGLDSYEPLLTSKLAVADHGLSRQGGRTYLEVTIRKRRERTPELVLRSRLPAP